jgi:ATP-dependent DNA helicase HFM1/MER3
VAEFWQDIRSFESDFNSLKPLTSTQRHQISQTLTALTKIFSQFTEFNQIQSKTIFPIFENSQNLLICAPTASGKTTLFDLTILKTIFTNKILSEPKNFDSKIIYCGPIKS